MCSPRASKRNASGRATSSRSLTRASTATVVVGKNDVVVEAKLGFLLAMFRDRIDEELVRILDKEFPEAKA